MEAFRWLPNGRGLVFVSWVWPGLKGAKAQAKQLKAFKERKETGYVTSEAHYRHWDRNLPEGRVARLHLLELGRDGAPGKVRDLFEGTAFELTRSDPGITHFDVSPDSRSIVFAFDPAARAIVAQREAMRVSWYATGGRFRDVRTGRARDDAAPSVRVPGARQRPG